MFLDSPRPQNNDEITFPLRYQPMPPHRLVVRRILEGFGIVQADRFTRVNLVAAPSCARLARSADDMTGI